MFKISFNSSTKKKVLIFLLFIIIFKIEQQFMTGKNYKIKFSYIITLKRLRINNNFYHINLFLMKIRFKIRIITIINIWVNKNFD